MDGTEVELVLVIHPAHHLGVRGAWQDVADVVHQAPHAAHMHAIDTGQELPEFGLARRHDRHALQIIAQGRGRIFQHIGGKVHYRVLPQFRQQPGFMFLGQQQYLHLDAPPMQFLGQTQDMGFNAAQAEGAMEQQDFFRQGHRMIQSVKVIYGAAVHGSVFWDR